MAGQVKALASHTKHYTKAEREAREKAEERYKVDNISKDIPNHLNGEVAEIYSFILDYVPEDLLGDVDTFTVEMVATNLAMMREAQRHLEDEGAIIEDGKINPWLKVKQSCEKQFIQASTKICLNPKDRSTLAVATNQEEEDPLDFIARYMRS